MRRFRCDGSLSSTPLIFRKGLGPESKNVLFAVYSGPQNKVYSLTPQPLTPDIGCVPPCAPCPHAPLPLARAASRFSFCASGSNRFGRQMGSTARPRGRPFEGQTGPQGVTHCRHTGGSGGGSGGSGGTCDGGRGDFSGCVC